MLPLQNGVRILDIGCGPGRVLLPLAKNIQDKGGHVTGLDIQADMIEKTRLKAEALGITNVHFINSSIDEAKIDESYDIILMICVLGEIPKNDRKSVMQKIARYLQPDGIISITETIFDPHFQSRKYGMEYLGSSFVYSGTKNEEYLSQNKDEVHKAKIKLGVVDK